MIKVFKKSGESFSYDRETVWADYYRGCICVDDFSFIKSGNDLSIQDNQNNSSAVIIKEWSQNSKWFENISIGGQDISFADINSAAGFTS